MRGLLRLVCVGIAIGAAGCGGSMSAPPPVSLPAPISGRFDGPITVGEQGGASQVNISAAPGSVAPHATILVINMTAEASLSLQISPAVSAICSQPTRTCVTADDVGGFSATIQCRAGETLGLVVIDPMTGKELGPRRYATVTEEETEEKETVAEAPGSGDAGNAGQTDDYQYPDGYTVDRIMIGYTAIVIGNNVTITNVSIYTTGDTGVKPYSTILATNEAVAAPDQSALPRRGWYRQAVVFLLRQLERFAWSEALANLFPSVCYADGRACAMADDSGQFKMQIVAMEGDEITIALIDPKTGKEQWRLKRVLVPKGAFKPSGVGSGSGGGGATAGGGKPEEKVAASNDDAKPANDDAKPSNDDAKKDEQSTPSGLGESPASDAGGGEKAKAKGKP